MKQASKRIIENIYRTRRENSAKLKAQHVEEVRSKIPEYEEVEFKIAQAGIELSKKAIAGLSVDTVMQNRIKELVETSNELLHEYGFPLNYCEETYICPDCKDTGYITGENGYSRACACRKQLVVRELFKESNIPENFENFEDFDLSLYPKEKRSHMKKLLDFCIDYTNNFTRENVLQNILFTGKTGLGKTYLCNIIACNLLKQGIPVIYMSAPELFRCMLKFGAEQDEADEIRNAVYTAELLIIDDLGTEKQSDSRYQILLDILNAREAGNKKGKCSTIISTNLLPKEICELYGERVNSRILGGFCILLFEGEDIRLKKLR
jgi:DNA replication protein DnaC